MRRWLVPAAFAAGALLTGAHAVDALETAATHPSGRAALIACYHVLRTAVALAFALFTLRRSEPHERARNPRALAACLAAMAAVLAFEAPGPSSPAAFVLAGDAIAVAFCLWLLVSVLALGRCFGVLPEARGLVTRGPYRIVRHPVYLGELGASAGLALTAPSLANALVLAALVIAQLVRMGYEEQALASAFPEYASYAASTPRLLPRVRIPSVGSVGGALPLLNGARGTRT
jgi:protein-S-isoprenylcysteine O-methyltransferase Ste14